MAIITPALAPAANLAYASVPFASQVSIIDAATNTVVGAVPFTDHPGPLAIAPGGATAYVALSNTVSLQGKLAIVDLASQAMVDSIPLPFNIEAMALHPNGTRAWVIPADGSNTALPIDLGSKRIGQPVKAGAGAIAIALASDGRRAYVANQTSGTVSVIDTSGGSVIASIPVGTFPAAVAVSPLGAEVWVGTQGPPGTSRLSVIDASSNAVIASLSIPDSPTGLAFDTTGNRVYVAHGAGISVVDPAARSLITTILTGSNTFSVAVSQDGTRVFGANYVADSVSIVDAATNTIVGTVALPDYSQYVATVPPQGTVYEAESPANTITGSARVEACSACSGGAAVTHLGSNENGSVIFNNIAGTARTYLLEIDYINGSNAGRTLFLSVNGGPATSVSLPNTGSWSSAPGTVLIKIQLADGPNFLQFSNNSSPGPNLDRIVLR